MKILAITTIRSDYDLLSTLYRKLFDDKEIELKLLVAGTHLSETYGRSCDLIEKDGFPILAKIESLIDSNSSQSRLKSASIMLISSIDIVANYKPDLIIYTGDREDTMIGALLGAYLKIPTLHFFGGDHATDGHVDNPIRHAVSKLSSVHFVALEDHRLRLLKMGEENRRIFNIGSIALDKFYLHGRMSKCEIKKQFNITSNFESFALVIFHPHDQEMAYSSKIFENILITLKELNINAFISYPNTDPGNKDIIYVISKYINDSNFCFYKNLERETFISILKTATLMIGNSSAGITESASVEQLPVVNIGLRQTGRSQSGNVLFCKSDKKDIYETIKKATSKNFLSSIKNIRNIYGEGKSTIKAYKLIKSLKFSDFLFKTADPLEQI